MTLVVEDGTGRADAESYASVEYADAYHIARGREESWFELDDEMKEQALRLAADFITQEYRLLWAGTRKTSTQALDWPRYDVPVRDAPGGSWYSYHPANVVPEEVRRANAELAFRAVATGALSDLSPDLSPPVLSKTVGPISVTYAEGARQTTRYAAVEALLAPLLSAASHGVSSVKVTRS
jgi:hypothetical protein